MSRISRRNLLKCLATTTALGTLGPQVAFGDQTGHGAQREKIILIHGAWQNGLAWAGVATRLRSAGYDVETPTLPGMNSASDTTDVSFADYVAAVIAAVRRQHRKVVLVGHSSAGMLLQEALPQVADQAVLAVFSNAFVVGQGQTQLDNIPPDAAANLTALAAATSDDTIPIAPIEGFVRGALMEGDLPAVQDAMLDIMLRQHFSLLSSPVNTGPFEASRTPRAVLFCTRDHSADYLGMAARLGAHDLVTAEGSHQMLFADPVGYTHALLKTIERAHCR